MENTDIRGDDRIGDQFFNDIFGKSRSFFYFQSGNIMII